MPDDPHFYQYTKNGFQPDAHPIPPDETGNLEWSAVLRQHGWIPDRVYGVEWTMQAETYYRETDTGERYVEVSDVNGVEWTCLVPRALWPRFLRDEIVPLVNSSALLLMHEQLERIANAVIGVGRHGIGGRDLNPITGGSQVDEREEQAARQAARAARRAEGGQA